MTLTYFFPYALDAIIVIVTIAAVRHSHGWPQSHSCPIIVTAIVAIVAIVFAFARSFSYSIRRSEAAINERKKNTLATICWGVLGVRLD